MYLFQELLILRKTFRVRNSEVFDGLVIVKGIAREAGVLKLQLNHMMIELILLELVSVLRVVN
jgi:hypothetical protein